MSCEEKLESIKHNAALAITGAIREYSSEKPYQGLGFLVHKTFPIL